MKKLFIRKCVGGVNTKGKMVELTPTVYEEIFRELSPEEEAYTSVFYFNEEQFEEFNKTGTVAGITNVVTDKLVFDFDDRSNPQNALDDSRTLYTRLISEGFKDETIGNFYSGNKGVHTTVKLTEMLTPEEVRNICTGLAGDLKTFDHSIYNATRIFREPLSKNKKGGRYKVPLTCDELFNNNIEQIMKLAEENLDYSAIKDYWQTQQLPPRLREIKNKTAKKEIVPVVKSLNIVNEISKIDWSQRPKDMSPEKWALEQGYFDEGDRSHALMILCSTYRAMGWDEKKAYYNLKSTSDKQAERTGGDKFSKEEIWNNIVKQVYSPRWKGGVYSSKTDYLLQAISQQIPAGILVKSSEKLLSVSQAFAKFKQYAKQYDKNKLLFGIPELDALIDAQAGRVYAILASPGVGKTTLLNQILNNVSRMGLRSIFFGFDMAIPDTMQKVGQRHTGLSAAEIYLKMNTEAGAKELESIVATEYSNVEFVDSTGLSIEEMRECILRYEQLHETEVKFIAVDYLDLIRSDYSDPTQRSLYSIQGLKEIAISMNKCVIVCCQPNKANQKINEPIETYAGAKGSSAVAEVVNAMITIHRPGYSSTNPENDKFFTLSTLKNRHGGLGTVELGWRGKTGEIFSLDEFQREELQTLKETRKAQQLASNQGF